MKKYIISYLKNTSLSIFRLLSFVIPKKRGLLVFQQCHNKSQFSGNIKSLALYAQKKYKGNSIFILALDDNLYIEVRNAGFSATRSKLVSFWKILRAEHIIIDATFSRYSGGKFPIIQLWHGTGFKNIGVLNNLNTKHKKRLINHYNNYELVVATSDDDAQRKRDSFLSNNVIITGSPRNDLFFKGLDFEIWLRKKYKAEKYNRIISYTPTFRDFETKLPFSNYFWENLNKYLIESNTLFIVKKHPWDKYLKVPDNYKNIRDMSSEIADVQELLIITDLLISDYSGIATDYSITNKPIIFYMYDMEIYLEKCRTIYYDLSEILPKPFVFDENELLDKIRNNDWTKTNEYQENYKSFRNRFHKYLDGDSSKRVIEAIKEL